MLPGLRRSDKPPLIADVRQGGESVVRVVNPSALRDTEETGKDCQAAGESTGPSHDGPTSDKPQRKQTITFSKAYKHYRWKRFVCGWVIYMKYIELSRVFYP